MLKSLQIALCGACLFVAAETPIQLVKTPMANDLRSRATDIHWPKGFEPEHAALFAHNQAYIAAGCNVIWQQIIDARSWPDWYPNARAVKILGGGTKLAPNTRWRWQTFGLSVESEVHEFEPERRLGWFGGSPNAPPAFYHSWLLTPDKTGCRVAMDEVGIGPGAAAFRHADEGRMHRGHALWLATLAWVAEGR